MKIYRFLLLATIISISVVSCLGLVNEAPQYPHPKEYCKDTPWCAFRAIEKGWPEKANIKVMQINLDPFAVDVPANFNRLSVMPHQILAVVYDDYVIFLALEGPENMGFGPAREILKQSNYEAIDYPKLVFTATPDDLEPENKYDRDVWRGAIREKATHLIDAKEGWVFKKGKIVAYTARVKQSVYTGDTVITHKGRPDLYLRIYDKSADPKVIYSIISSFRMTN